MSLPNPQIGGTDDKTLLMSLNPFVIIHIFINIPKILASFLFLNSSFLKNLKDHFY